MKIVNVTPGLIPIPPNGWGAVEKILWEIHQNLLKLGHDSHITYLDDIPSDADVVHIHTANLALMARDKGIPYYFTTHDHHAYLHGKNSWAYQENLEAMKYAIKSFVPAKYLIPYFDNLPSYFSHGVNTDIFIPSSAHPTHRLLCVANNGYIHDPAYDRKGFGVAIEVARKLNLPLTIAGPENNKRYFSKYPPDYDKLTILYNLTEEELLTVYNNHTIFIHPSELEAGHPNLTLLEALSCGLPIVGTLESSVQLEGMKTTDRDVTEITQGVMEVLDNYNEYRSQAIQQANKLNWKHRVIELLTIYQAQTNTMKNELLSHYNSTTRINKRIPVRANYYNVDGLFLELLGGDESKYDVSFINNATNQTHYSVELQRNHWARPAAKYYVDWKIQVLNKTNNEIMEYKLDFKNKRVLICFESKSLGDTLAWIPYVEEFRKHHNCRVICSTFWNDMFKEVYPEVEFVEPGQQVEGLLALYRIGIFYTDGEIDYTMHPRNPLPIPLQQVATDILGLPFTEIRPRIKEPAVESSNSKQVCIGIHSTAQTKYWNNPTGWQEVVDWLNNKGYTVKLLSQEGDGYMGNRLPTGIVQHPTGPMENVISELKKSQAFIGVSSGLSWVSWATNTPTVMISGFTDPNIEMESCIRISAPKGKCSGCWSRHKFNPGDWNWCPDHKGTPRQFECSREITADMVIKELEKIL